MANKLAQEIENVLSQEVGEFIARATVKKNCELIGTTPDALTTDQISDLAEKIEKSVVFFSGEDVSSELVNKIKALKI